MLCEICLSDLRPLPRTMLAPVILSLLPALLADYVGNTRVDRPIRLMKCCGQYEKLSGNARSCVQSDWGRSAKSKWFFVAPFDEEVVKPWLPPGLPLQNVSAVVFNRRRYFSHAAEVNSSFLWDKSESLDDDVWERDVVFLGDEFIARPRPRPYGGHRAAHYCLDAASPPFEDSLLFYKTLCTYEECVAKCCPMGKVLVNKGGVWQCDKDKNGYWSPKRSSLRKDLGIDSEFPFEEPQWKDNLLCRNPRLATLEDRPARWAPYEFRHFLFVTWKVCVDYYRNNSTLLEALFYCEHQRLERGIYWLLRPLCVVSALVLAMALLSIACDSGMRRKPHGWCLANHALCLFGFNMGQIVYYVAISDKIDAIFKEKIPADLQRTCTYLALSMYFLLTAAWFWLTALCVNMAQGFRLQAALSRRRGRRKFLAFSSIAWGLPALMTLACYFMFTPPVDFANGSTLPWYYPSLMEARMCYNEPFHVSYLDIGYHIFTYKSGTALFYYYPMGFLVFCNIVCILITLWKVQRLRRGNSVLRREEDGGGQGNPRHAASVDDAQRTSRGRARGGAPRTTVDAKTIKLYLKMLLMTGLIEIISETIIWSTTRYSKEYTFQFRDYHYPYRSSGYVTDFFRAACVAWLAAPEGGYLGPVLKRLRTDKK